MASLRRAERGPAHQFQLVPAPPTGQGQKQPVASVATRPANGPSKHHTAHAAPPPATVPDTQFDEGFPAMHVQEQLVPNPHDPGQLPPVQHPAHVPLHTGKVSLHVEVPTPVLYGETFAASVAMVELYPVPAVVAVGSVPSGAQS